MPYCTNCGEEVTDEQRYCSYCGERLGDDSRQRRSGGGTDDTPTQSGTHDDSRTRHRTGREPPSPSETSADGFQGDPPPEGYEDPPGVHDTPSRGSRSDGTLDIFTSAFKGIFSLPLVLLGLFVAWFLFSILIIVPPGLGLGVLLLSSVIGLVAAGMTYVYAEGELHGEDVAAGEAASAVFGQFLSLLVIWILFVPAFLFGFALFILPGLYIGGRLLLAFPACVLDGEGTLDSLSTSWNLTSGISLKPFGFLALALISAFLLAIILTIPQSIVFSVMGVELAEFETVEEALALMEDPQIAITNAVFQAIALAIPVGAVQIAAARLYLQERYGPSESDERY